MILVIAEQNDNAGRWLAAQLSARTARRVATVTPLQLVLSTSIAHRLSTTSSSSSFRLADGTELELATVSGVVNRMGAMPMTHLARASAADRDYAAGEWHAFLLGWLASLECPVLNPPAPEWLAGVSRSTLVTRHFAAAAGLEVTSGSADDPALLEHSTVGAGGESHFACQGQLVGPILDASAREAILTFANSYGASLIQVETEATATGRRRFLGATSFPDYVRGGRALVAAIQRVLGA